jgi:hypothetical protein
MKIVAKGAIRDLDGKQYFRALELADVLAFPTDDEVRLEDKCAHPGEDRSRSRRNIPRGNA